MQILLILNDPPCGTERCYNGLRLALAPAKSEPAAVVTMFLMADAAVAAKAGQNTPDGYYNIERMLKGVMAGKGQILLCGTWMDARGLTEADILAGARRSNMNELAAACRRLGAGVLSEHGRLRDTPSQARDLEPSAPCNRGGGWAAVHAWPSAGAASLR